MSRRKNIVSTSLFLYYILYPFVFNSMQDNDCNAATEFDFLGYDDFLESGTWNLAVSGY